MKYTKRTPKQKKKEERKKTELGKPKKGGNLSTLTRTSPQNLENNTSQQGLSCLSPARTKTLTS
jgi:hypothetical protein